MAALDPTKSRVMEGVAAFVIVAFTAMEAFLTAAPYFGLAAHPGDIATLAQQQTLVQTVMIAIISFLFGASVGTQALQKAVASSTASTKTAQDALNPTQPDVTVPVGASVKVAAVDDPTTPTGDPT